MGKRHEWISWAIVPGQLPGDGGCLLLRFFGGKLHHKQDQILDIVFTKDGIQELIDDLVKGRDEWWPPESTVERMLDGRVCIGVKEYRDIREASVLLDRAKLAELRDFITRILDEESEV